jgi:hypothetical protein
MPVAEAEAVPTFAGVGTAFVLREHDLSKQIMILKAVFPLSQCSRQK